MKQTVFEKDCNPQFHPTATNSKLGKMLGVSYVPGNELFYLNNGTLVSDTIGTCGKVDCSSCGKRGICYAINSFVQYPSCTKNRVENTLQLRSDIDGHFADIENEFSKKKYSVLRYTESGEIETYDQFIRVCETALHFPEKAVYLYTKNYAVLDRYFSEGNELPENMTVLISVWGENGVVEYERFKHHDGIKAFVVNNSNYKVDVMCPAYRKDENGKVYRVKSKAVQCAHCKLCTRERECKIIGCYEH